jgi:hypothetical protein
VFSFFLKLAESLDYSAFPPRNETKSSHTASIHAPIHSTPLCKGRKSQITIHSPGEIFIPFPIFSAIPNSSCTAALGFSPITHSLDPADPQSITQSLGPAHQICHSFTFSQFRLLLFTLQIPVSSCSAAIGSCPDRPP